MLESIRAAMRYERACICVAIEKNERNISIKQSEHGASYCCTRTHNEREIGLCT